MNKKMIEIAFLKEMEPKESGGSNISFSLV